MGETLIRELNLGSETVHSKAMDQWVLVAIIGKWIFVCQRIGHLMKYDNFDNNLIDYFWLIWKTLTAAFGKMQVPTL